MSRCMAGEASHMHSFYTQMKAHSSKKMQKVALRMDRAITLDVAHLDTGSAFFVR